MGDRPNVHAENLLAAGRRFGDAAWARDLAIRSWKPDDPRNEMRASLAEAKEAQAGLERAARAYATRMRRKNKPKPPEPLDPEDSSQAEDGRAV